MHNFNIKISIGCLTVSKYSSAPLPFHTKVVTSKKQVGTKQLNNIQLNIILRNLTIKKRTSLNALCVSKWRLIRLSASWGLSYACSISPNSSLWDWFNRLFTLQKTQKGRTNNSLKSSCNRIESPSNFVVNLLLFAGYLGGFTHILFNQKCNWHTHICDK